MTAPKLTQGFRQPPVTLKLKFVRIIHFVCFILLIFVRNYFKTLTYTGFCMKNFYLPICSVASILEEETKNLNVSIISDLKPSSYEHKLDQPSKKKRRVLIVKKSK